MVTSLVVFNPLTTDLFLILDFFEANFFNGISVHLGKVGESKKLLPIRIVWLIIFGLGLDEFLDNKGKGFMIDFGERGGGAFATLVESLFFFIKLTHF